MSWNRILVTGFPGAGKTTMIRGLRDAIHLDDLLEKAGPSAFRWRRSKVRILEHLSLQKRWIAEGVAGMQFLPEIIQYAKPDLIVFVHGGDFRRFRVTWRWWVRLRRATSQCNIPLFEVRKGEGWEVSGGGAQTVREKPKV